MIFNKELNEGQFLVLVPFEELKVELIKIIQQEIQGLKLESEIKPESPQKFYTPIEVRSLFKISRSTLYNWKTEGLLVPKKIGGKVLYEKKAVELVVGKKCSK